MTYVTIDIVNELANKLDIKKYNTYKKDKEEPEININLLENKYKLRQNKYFYLSNKLEDYNLKKNLIENHCVNKDPEKISNDIRREIKNIYRIYPYISTNEYTYISDMKLLKEDDIIVLVSNDLVDITDEQYIKRIKRTSNNTVISITIFPIHDIKGIVTICPKKYYIFRKYISNTDKTLLLRKRKINQRAAINALRRNHMDESKKNKEKKVIEKFFAEIAKTDNIDITKNEFSNMDTDNLIKFKEKLLTENKTNNKKKK